MHIHRYVNVSGWFGNEVKQCRKCLKVKVIPFHGYATEDIHQMNKEELRKLDEMVQTYSRKKPFPTGPWTVVGKTTYNSDRSVASIDYP